MVAIRAGLPLAAALIVVGNANAAEITYAPRGDKYVDISIHGTIVDGDDQRFRDIEKAVSAFHSTKTITVMLDGPGGMLGRGLTIGEAIRQHGWMTWVPTYTVCGSVCASIWIAGTRRWATNTSLIGFHAASDVRQLRESGTGNAILGAYYTKMGLTYDAIAYLTTASPNEVIYLSRESARTYGIAYENALPSEGAIQLMLQASRSMPQQSGIMATVTENLMLRLGPDPLSPSLLEGLSPDYIPAGQRFNFTNFSQACTRIYSGRIWCRLNVNGHDGQLRRGWVNAYYLLLNNGVRVACLLDRSSSQISECRS
jgi:hypothetical protein